MTQKQFLNEFNTRFSKEFDLVTPIKELFPTDLSNIRKDKTKITIRHKYCGTEFEILIKGLFGTKYKDPKDYGRICPKCRYLLTDEEVYQKFKDKFGFIPYEILEPYKNIRTKMKLRCKQCNNIIEVTLGNLMNFGQFSKTKNYYCPYCSNEIASKAHSKDADYFMNRITSLTADGVNPYELLEYNGVDSLNKVRCKKCKDEFYVTGTNIYCALQRSKGKLHYCPKCNGMKRSELSYEERLKIRNPDVINLEPYINRTTKILHMCTRHYCGYKWKATPNNILKGEGCPKCAHRLGNSIIEDEVKDYLKKLHVKCICRSRKILSSSRELDIYCPEYNFAIECDGAYWHCDRYKDKNYHLQKTIDCEKLGIQLIHILDTDWLDSRKKRIIKDKIKTLLKLNTKKIYARECIIKEIDSNTKNKFLEKNHIQGKDKSNIKLGLYTSTKYYEKEILVAVMTFCKPRKALGHKKDSKYDYELSRYASLLGYNILGGFSKLLKYFERNYEWKEIVTYADRKWSNGTVYLKNNFTLDHISKPSYFYYNRNTNEVVNRYNFRKSNLKNLFPEYYNESLTEFQIVDSTKIWCRVWDCGNYVFTYKKEDI